MITAMGVQGARKRGMLLIAALLASSVPFLWSLPGSSSESFPAAGPAVRCDDDGAGGKRVEFLYVHAAGQASRLSEYLDRFRQYAAQMDAWVNESAAKTGGTRHIRFVTEPPAGDGCSVVVADVTVPDGAVAADMDQGSLVNIRNALVAQGYRSADRKYVALVDDSQLRCGGTMAHPGEEAAWYEWTDPGPGNPYNYRPTYAFVSLGDQGKCFAPGILLHELTHALGALMPGAPHVTPSSHCTDTYEIMCDPLMWCADLSHTADPECHAEPGESACPPSHRRLLDCNNDDYFHTNPPPGSYLASHWNVADSEFLIKEARGT